MVWVRLDDTFADDPLLDSAGPAAAWLHVAGLCYSSRNLTDGFIAADRVRRLTAVPDVDDVVAELVRLGLWKWAAGGYQIVHHLEHQPTRAEVERERKLKTERQARWRNRRKPDQARNSPPGVDASTAAKSQDVDASRDALRDASRDGAPTRPVVGSGAHARARDPRVRPARAPCTNPDCRNGWLEADDEGRPRPCPTCKPNAAASAARRYAS